MSPRADSYDTTDLIELFKSIGLTQSKAAEAAKSPKSAAMLKDIIEDHALVDKQLEEKQAVLLASLAVQGSKLGGGERGYAVSAILDGRVKSTDQVSGALFTSLPIVELLRLRFWDLKLRQSTWRRIHPHLTSQTLTNIVA